MTAKVALLTRHTLTCGSAGQLAMSQMGWNFWKTTNTKGSSLKDIKTNDWPQAVAVLARIRPRLYLQLKKTAEDETINGRMNEWMHACMNEWINEWMNEWMNLLLWIISNYKSANWDYDQHALSHQQHVQAWYAWKLPSLQRIQHEVHRSLEATQTVDYYLLQYLPQLHPVNQVQSTTASPFQQPPTTVKTNKQ